MFSLPIPLIIYSLEDLKSLKQTTWNECLGYVIGRSLRRWSLCWLVDPPLALGVFNEQNRHKRYAQETPQSMTPSDKALPVITVSGNLGFLSPLNLTLHSCMKPASLFSASSNRKVSAAHCKLSPHPPLTGWFVFVNHSFQLNFSLSLSFCPVTVFFCSE